MVICVLMIQSKCYFNLKIAILNILIEQYEIGNFEEINALKTNDYIIIMLMANTLQMSFSF